MGTTKADIRGKVEAACFLRDTFRRDGNEAAALVCSNFSCLVQVEAGASWEEIHAQGSADLLPRFAIAAGTRRAKTAKTSLVRRMPERPEGIARTL